MKKYIRASISATREQKRYIMQCLDEAPQVPGPDEPEEKWSQYHRDIREYKMWAFIDAVDMELFTEDEEDLFNQLWDRFSTEMAMPFA